MDNQFNNQSSFEQQNFSNQQNFTPTPLKSKLVAVLLAFFVGSFGVHNFYLGYTQKAWIQLILTLVGFLLICVIVGIIPIIGVAIWAFVEAIQLLTGSINCDGEGRPLAE